jgi:predicted RNase H-like HicB family nuclease
VRYSVLLEPVAESELGGFYYAHIPALDLTTHGAGVEGALAAAQELVTAWVAEKKAHGEPVPVEARSFVAHVEIPDAVLGP